MDKLEIEQKPMLTKPDSICPLCGATVENKVGDTLVEINNSPREAMQHIPPIGVPSFSFQIGEKPIPINSSRKDETLRVRFLYCPYCNNTSSKVFDLKRKAWINIYPRSAAKQFPDVPPEVYKDYVEACDILSASPTASATLSRRCLQRMVRNRWNIELKRLIDEIDTIPATNITQLEREALHAVREIGNIGAHPDMILEVTQEDAELTIRIIEIFLQKWYIDEPAIQNALSSAVSAKRQKKAQKDAAKLS